MDCEMSTRMTSSLGMPLTPSPADTVPASADGAWPGPEDATARAGGAAARAGPAARTATANASADRFARVRAAGRHLATFIPPRLMRMTGLVHPREGR